MKTLRDYKTVADRRKAIEKLTKTLLKNIGTYSLDEEVVGKKNCENMIGATQVPLGIAGPIKVKSQKSKIKSYFLPLATTEGALIASINRGCKAITQSGGAIVESVRIGATRGPVFVVSDNHERHILLTYLKDNFSVIKKTAESTSHHLQLLRYSTYDVGKYVYVRFYFDTQDAMGLNMITIATDAITRLIKEKLHISCLALSGNFCVDKKPSWSNSLSGRGFRVSSEVTISKDILQKVLKTTAHNVYEVWLAKCMVGSAVSGTMGFNAHIANVVTALFIATGQDPAHVVAASMGITTMRVEGDDLYASVTLPSVMVGTIGGGTALATQKEALQLLGVFGGNNGKNAQRLAEIVGAASLAGEISLLSSLSEGTLSRAHQQLGR